MQNCMRNMAIETKVEKGVGVNSVVSGDTLSSEISDKVECRGPRDETAYFILRI